MTRDGIIRMARLAAPRCDNEGLVCFDHDELERFAALVAAAAKAEEREACAKIAEFKFIGAKDGNEECGWKIATAIRARSQQ